MKSQRKQAAALVLLAALLVVPFLTAQDMTTGEISGRVLDLNTGSPLTGASMMLTNLRNGKRRPGRTDSKGNYFFIQLAPGYYNVQAEPAGYVSEERKEVFVPLNLPRVVIPPFRLRSNKQAYVVPEFRPRLSLIGARITASGYVQDSPQTQTPAPPAIVTESGLTSLVSLGDWALRSNFDLSVVQNLPLPGGRSFDHLARFAPGVARPPFSSGEGPAVGIGVGSLGQFAVNGLRSRSNNFTVDGSDNNDEDIGVRRQGFVALVPQSTESIEEFQIMTAGFPAQFGRNSGSMVNAISGSGNNDVHGTIYGFFNNDALNARNFFDTAFADTVNTGDLNGGRYSGKDSVHSQYGGAVGGAAIANRLFYFISGEQQRGHGTALHHFVVPAGSERGLRVRRNPGLPIINDVKPIDELQDFFDERSIPYSATAGNSIFSLYPLTNNSAGPFVAHNYSQAQPFEADSNLFSTRLDWYHSQTHSVAARYNFTQDESRIPFTSEAINSAIGARTRIQNLSLFLNSTWPSVGNALRISFGRTRLAFPPDKGSPLLFGSSTVGAPQDFMREVQTSFGHFGPFGVTGPIGQLSILPYSTIGVDVYNFPQGRIDNTYQFSDFLTLIRDRHVTRFGFDMRRSQLNSFADRNSRPLMVFGYGSVDAICMQNPFCPFATSDAMLHGTDLAALGAPSGFLQALSTDPAADTTIGLRIGRYDLFLQDDWKAATNLTVNLGLRYELQTVPHETNNRIEKTFSLTPAQFGHLEPVGSAENQAIIRAGNRAFDEALQGLQQFLAGRQRIYAADHNNFGPRIGFAWDPGGEGKSAIHAGYSLQFDADPGAFTSQSRNVFPTFVPVNLDVNFQRPTGIIVNSPTFFRFRPTQTLLIKPGSLNVYNLTGNEFATGLGTLLNQQPPNPTDNLSSNGLAFTLPERNLKTAYAQHYVVSAEHQVDHDWLLSAVYVGTHGVHLPRFRTPNGGLISSPVLFSSVNQPLTIVANPASYGGRPFPSLGAFTAMENSASSTYHGMQLSVLKRLSRNLQLRSNWTWSHAIDDVSDIFDARGFFALPEDNARPGRERASANFDTRHRLTGFLTWEAFHQWSFALTGEFQTGQPYTINTVVDRNGDGNLTDRPGVGRNGSRAAGLGTIDVAVTRSISLGSGRAVDARLEVFNLFNKANLGIPTRIRESPGFGTPFDTQINSRSVRLAAKLRF